MGVMIMDPDPVHRWLNPHPDDRRTLCGVIPWALGGAAYAEDWGVAGAYTAWEYIRDDQKCTVCKHLHETEGPGC